MILCSFLLQICLGQYYNLIACAQHTLLTEATRKSPPVTFTMSLMTNVPRLLHTFAVRRASHGMESVLDISSGNTQTQHISECSNIGTRRQDEECAYLITTRFTIRTRAHCETTAASLYASMDPSRKSSTNAFVCGHQQEEKHRLERATHTSFIVMKTKRDLRGEAASLRESSSRPSPLTRCRLHTLVIACIAITSRTLQHALSVSRRFLQRRKRETIL